MAVTTALNAQAPDPHQALTYPPARVSDQHDTYFGTTVPDPYRWMEEVDSPEVARWVEAENTLTQSFLADVPARERIHARLLELNDYERFSPPERQADRIFYRRNAGLQNQAVLYWQQASGGEPKVLLDPNTLRADGTVALQSTSVTDDGKLLAYSLAEAGSDIEKIHVRRVDTGQDLPDLVDYVKFSGISWRKDGSGFYYSSFGVPKSEAERAQALKSLGGFHKVYFHKLGTPQADDQVIYERPDDKEILTGASVSEDGRWLYLFASKGDYNEVSLRDLTKPSAPAIVIAGTLDAVYEPLLIIGHELWLKTNKDAPRSKIVKIDLEHPEPARWKLVVPESKNQMDSATTVHDTLFLNYLVDAQTEIDLYKLDGTLDRKLQLPGIGSAAITGGKRTDTDTYFVFTNYTSPATIYKLDLKTYNTAIWKAPRLPFDPKQYETKLVFAPSKDGTKIPLFITYKKGIKLDGTAPTILYGYGGFNVSLGPAYASSRLAWMELGGIYAEAILRGGGEYGEAWHQGGTKLHKQNVFDDFIGCAQFLIANRYTAPAKLAINGGSNGGLLVGAVELQRPELFGAVLAQVGVMDMLRFDKFTIGYAWKADYGSPSDNEADFRNILKYSPIHNVHAGTHYPPTLITTADHDDRVFPAHSFKFAAAMQAAATATPGAAPQLIRIETRAGHGGGMPLSKQLDVTADMYAFLVKVLNIH